MSTLFNFESERTSFELKALTVRSSRGKPGCDVDLQLVLDTDADEMKSGVQLPGRLKSLSTAARTACEGGDSVKHEVQPNAEGRLELFGVVNDVDEDAYAGAATLRKVRLHATSRYARIVYVVRVHFAHPRNSADLLDLLGSTARAQFTAAQLALVEGMTPPSKGKGKRGQGSQTEDLAAL